MKDWFVYQADGNHIGPVSTELLARGVLAGKVPRDAHVGAHGDPQWYPLLSVPEIDAEVKKLAGQPVHLQGRAGAGATSVTLERRLADGSWSAADTTAPGADGAFAFLVAPDAPSTYRAVTAAGPSAPGSAR